MAAAYTQLTGTPGAVLVTAGPGVTNVATPVPEPFVGTLPVIILDGWGSTASAYVAHIAGYADVDAARCYLSLADLLNINQELTFVA
jgi:thiamine pyrophosphate-dependent acetolactate synthase large subunit-like protein